MDKLPDIIAKLITEDPDLLLEYKCPKCGDPDAYAGLHNLECPNYACDKFSQRRADEVGRKPPAHEVIGADKSQSRSAPTYQVGIQPTFNTLKPPQTQATPATTHTYGGYGNHAPWCAVRHSGPCKPKP
jgi:hypothetical protein